MYQEIQQAKKKYLKECEESICFYRKTFQKELDTSFKYTSRSAVTSFILSPSPAVSGGQHRGQEASACSKLGIEKKLKMLKKGAKCLNMSSICGTKTFLQFQCKRRDANLDAIKLC